MRKIGFILKLIEEEKIKLVSSSLEVSKSYILKSKNSLKASKVLFNQDLYEESISMSYYSMFHMVQSLFFKVGIKCENHSGAIILLKELFGVDNEKISFAKKERIDKQYYIDFSITKDDCEDLIKMSEEFCLNLYAFIDKISLEDIDKYREEFEENKSM